ncbi:hypothetical protein GQ55_3G225900 [Panicum hallii var. hallii]|uniref:Uncharacterized protein n=1 Tax=Panicum hallii var. hallii TaxID=1504633 RepID=A0A2T7ECC2_9POAL|nr:hypothetical protein GQ55_3G225900 [Panicum hallii var. hallii]
MGQFACCSALNESSFSSVVFFFWVALPRLAQQHIRLLVSPYTKVAHFRIDGSITLGGPSISFKILPHIQAKTARDRQRVHESRERSRHGTPFN